ncbi:hypothetical protein PF005_g14572 [Phytophthora fragariae]|uniref:Uncharacterized protein n=1 Tax=Phytophthora fragariae TaxID=53985 RepID=A0A6A3IL19_9STRA|nr:hypothetical protein PF003_g38317 [Phytophthora fragariae]KAE8934041.1 hypothetical protein PF009_g15978 [Phytophthora fragariae]KAE8983649.1 hypothetical protein PF011_g21092 [Phytophthora fragariae]KAE9101824.1 hypothetical protein PF007_g14987 [Phytophthora fragariae]KAE9101930.1 hypothetical protein PF010_g14292 [Phytophthora fragariae]
MLVALLSTANYSLQLLKLLLNNKLPFADWTGSSEIALKRTNRNPTETHDGMRPAGAVPWELYRFGPHLAAALRGAVWTEAEAARAPSSTSLRRSPLPAHSSISQSRRRVERGQNSSFCPEAVLLTAETCSS